MNEGADICGHQESEMVPLNSPPPGGKRADALWATEEPALKAFSQVLLTTDHPDPIRIKGSGVGIGIRYLSAQSVV